MKSYCLRRKEQEKVVGHEFATCKANISTGRVNPFYIFLQSCNQTLYEILEEIHGWWCVTFFINSIAYHTQAEKAMAPHSSTLAWKIPWMEEPGRLQSMGSLRVGDNWETSLFTFMHWRRKWQPTPVFLPAESQGWGSLVGCRLWGRTESDTTEAT